MLGTDMADIIECMATSDNVVRAGLTPKLRDVDTLIDMLTYEAGPASQQLLKPTPFEDGSNDLLYDPPIDEFSVVKISLNSQGGSSSKQRAVEGPSICVITKGNGSVKFGEEGKEEKEKLDLSKGDVVFVGAGTGVEWSGEEELEVFRAFVEVK